MCDLCGGPDGPAPRGFNRRQMLIMSASLAGGVALGFWSCREDGTPATAPAGTLGSQTASTRASQPATAASGTSPASSRAASQTQARATSATAAQTQEASQGAPAPNLGSEVFPDAAGKPIARASDAPVIMVPRKDWTTAPPRFSQIVLMNGIGRITVHHSAGLTETDAWNPTAAQLEGIREFHSGTRPADRGWADIAYHFAVDRAGRVWQARPLVYQGAHARQHNEHNLGIVLLGDFEVQSPSAAQLVSLGLFIGFVRRLYGVPLGQVFTHGELVETECPGKALQEFMNRQRTEAAAGEGVAWTAAATRPIPDASLPAMTLTMPASGPARGR